MKLLPSLRARLLRHVIAPLALTWLVGVMIALSVAHYFTQQAFDRALLDDAYAVATHVRHAEDGGLTLGLTAAACLRVMPACVRRRCRRGTRRISPKSNSRTSICAPS